MNFIHSRADWLPSAMLCVAAFGATATHAAELGGTAVSANHAAAVVQIVSVAKAPASGEVRAHATAHAVATPGRVPLDLRVPELRNIMSHSQLEDELRDTTDPQESVEIVAAPALVPMSLDIQIPLGVVGSLQWSIEHPTQLWRILLPNPTA